MLLKPKQHLAKLSWVRFLDHLSNGVGLHIDHIATIALYSNDILISIILFQRSLLCTIFKKKS